jgi:hypothetical protein
METSFQVKVFPTQLCGLYTKNSIREARKSAMQLTLIPDDLLDRPAGTSVGIYEAVWIGIAKANADHEIQILRDLQLFTQDIRGRHKS